MNELTAASEELAYDILIVGAGPVGLTTALMLARRNWRVAVIERWPAPYARPRAVHFDGETARLFAAAGIGPTLSHELTEPASDYQWQNAAGATLLDFDWSQPSPSGWPGANMFNQPMLERVLETAVGAAPTIDVFRGHEAVELIADPKSVRITTRLTDGSARTFAGAWAIGCDGANSFVRSRMATAVTDLGFFFDWLIVDVVPHERREWIPTNLQICDPKRPTTVVSGGPGRRRWEFMRMPGESIEELNNEVNAWRLLAPWNLTPENATLERHAVYTFQARWVDDWREGRLLLAGDAAHLMPPFAGQGMCSGIRDAANLTWKLDLVLRGLASNSLLDSYAPERRAHVQHAIGMSVELGKVICVIDEEAAKGRDAFMLSKHGDPAQILPPLPPPMLTEGLLRRAPDGSPAAGAGFLVPQPRVSYRGRTGLLDDVAGIGTMLIALDDPSTALSPAQREFLLAIDAHIMHLVPAGALPASPEVAVDLDDALGAWLRAGGFAAVLIRPDFYAFGTAGAPADVAALVDDFAHRLWEEILPADTSAGANWAAAEREHRADHEFAGSDGRV